MSNNMICKNCGLDDTNYIESKYDGVYSGYRLVCNKCGHVEIFTKAYSDLATCKNKKCPYFNDNRLLKYSHLFKDQPDIYTLSIQGIDMENRDFICCKCGTDHTTHEDIVINDVYCGYTVECSHCEHTHDYINDLNTLEPCPTPACPFYNEYRSWFIDNIRDLYDIPNLRFH